MAGSLRLLPAVLAAPGDGAGGIKGTDASAAAPRPELSPRSAALFCEGTAVKVEAETSGCDKDWPRAPEVTGKYFA